MCMWFSQWHTVAHSFGDVTRIPTSPLLCRHCNPRTCKASAHITASAAASPAHPPQVVHSEDNTAACGEPPQSPYACGMYGGLWQHGEAHNIVFSAEHASVTNEVRAGEVLLCSWACGNRSMAPSAAAVGAGLRDALPCPPRTLLRNSAWHLRSGACGPTDD